MDELKDIPKQNPFKVPENYFSNLNERILSATSDAAAVKKRKLQLFRLKPLHAIAASVTLFFAIGIIAVFLAGNGRKREIISDAAMVIITESYLNEIDLLILEENTSGMDLFPENTGVNNDDLIEYLVHENINDIEIYEKL